MVVFHGINHNVYKIYVSKLENNTIILIPGDILNKTNILCIIFDQNSGLGEHLVVGPPPPPPTYTTHLYIHTSEPHLID